MRQVETTEGKDLAKKYNFKFYETSALSGININEGFEALAMEIVGDIKSVKAERKTSTSLKDQKHKTKESEQRPCC